jgi:hypothetical protein
MESRSSITVTAPSGDEALDPWSVDDRGSQVAAVQPG